MNKLFTFSSLLVSGVLLGSIAGRFTNSETFKIKRPNIANNIKSVKDFISKNNDEDEYDQYFI